MSAIAVAASMLGSLRNKAYTMTFVLTSDRSADVGIDVVATEPTDHSAWPPRHLPGRRFRCPLERSSFLAGFSQNRGKVDVTF
jgi:hypothetical protein